MRQFVEATGPLSTAGLASCSSSSSDTGQPAGSTSASDSGSSDSYGDSYGDTIKIGFFSTQSGFAASDGKSALDAANLAMKHINADGGLSGAQIQAVPYNESSATSRQTSPAPIWSG